MARLGDYTCIKTGKLDANASSDNGIYPFFTCSKEPLSIDSYSYDCECVLVAGNGDLNVKYYLGKFDAYQRTYIVESNNKEKLLVRYLYYFLDKYVETLREQSIGGVIKYIKLGNLTEAHIPLPSLEEQRKIAAVLDKVSDLIAKRRTQLDKLDELVKSRFIEMFGDVTKNEKNWSTRKISEIATLQSGGTPSRQCPKYFEGTIPWITTVALGKNAIGIEDAIEYITEEAIENSATKLIPKNSLLFGIRVGVGKVSENIVPMCINQDIVAIIINDRYKLNMLFLKNLLDMFSGYFNSQKRGATIQGIKSEVLKNISVSLPPIELQNQFAAFVKQTDKSKLAIQKSLEKLEILKKSLMQKYFD